MTKFILHGGYTQRQSELNRQFFAQTTKEVPNGGTVLVVYFARPTKEWKELLQQDRQNFLTHADGKDVNVLMASEDGFLDQVRTSDAVYIRGGDPDKLMATLKRSFELSKLLCGKIVAGSSAGAYAISTFYWSNTKQGVCKGLGWAPVKVICHFDGKQTTIDTISKVSPDLELVVLQDCEWREVSLP